MAPISCDFEWTEVHRFNDGGVDGDEERKQNTGVSDGLEEDTSFFGCFADYSSIPPVE